MKRFILVFVVTLALIGVLTACGGSGESGNKAGTTNEATSKSSGDVFENDFFKVTLADGWTVFDDSRVKMMRIYPKNNSSIYAPTIHLKFEGSGNWAGTPEQSISNMAKNYNGTAPEKEVINGIEYYKTTYEYASQKQTMFVASHNGSKVTVTLIGKEYEKLPEIPKMMATLSYK